MLGGRNIGVKNINVDMEDSISEQDEKEFDD